MAFFFPSAFVLLCLVKKLTVIGIIGNTQGVNKAAKPPKKAKKKIAHNPFFSSLGAEVGAISFIFFSTSELTTEEESKATEEESAVLHRLQFPPQPF